MRATTARTDVTGTRALAAVVAAAMLARLGWVVATAGTGPLFDKYFWLARKLAAVQWLPDIAFTSSPLYTYLFAALTVGLGWEERDLRLLQSAIGACAVGVAWLAFRDLAGRTVATLGAVVLALHPTAVLYDTQPLPEAWINLANATALLGLGRLGGPQAPRWAAFVGAVTGLSTLLRPTALLWLPLIAFRLAGNARGRATAVARTAIAAALAFACAVLPAAVVNWRAEGRLILSTTAGGLNLYNGNSHPNRGYTFLSPPSVKHLEAVLIGDAIRQPITPEHLAWQRAAGWAAGRALSLKESSDFWVGEVRAYAAREPLAFLRGLARKARFFLHAFEPHDTESAQVRGARWGPFGFWLPALVWALALVGMALALPRWRTFVAPYALFAAYWGTCTLLYVSARLREPALLPAAFFAALAIVAVPGAAADRRPGRLAGFGALAATALAITAWPHPLVREMARFTAVDAELVRPGLARYRRGEVAAALEMLGQAVERHPPLAAPIARALAGGRDETEVRRFVDRLYAIDLAAPGDAVQSAVRARIRAVVAHVRENRLSDALAELDAALDLDPWNWDLHNARARVLAQTGRWEEALAAFEQSLAAGRNVQADVGAAYREMSACAQRAGRREQAEDYERRARFVEQASGP